MSARQRTACAFVTLVLGVAIAILLGAGAARAVSAPSPWDGVNPFDCTIQDAGQGTTVPDPGADPYCVRFDKTNQNVTELGLVDFLSKEPARVAAAVPKCFYYQEDHWRGSLVQSNQQTVVYEFFGHYFFNKATGDGGVWVTGFTVAGQTFDPRTLPGFPPQWDRYFGPGTGGVISHNDVPVDSSCVGQRSTSPSPIYASPPTAGSTPQPPVFRCDDVHGRVSRSRLGPLKLGMSEGRVLADLGSPQTVKRGVLRYCLARGGTLLLTERGRRAKTVALITTSRGFTAHGAHGRMVRVGATTKSLLAAFPRATRMFKLGRRSVVRLTPLSSTTRAGAVIAAIVGGHVVDLGLYQPRPTGAERMLAEALRATG